MDLELKVIGSFWQGQPISLALKFMDKAGDPADAADPVLTLFNPATETTNTYTTRDLSHDGTGDYSVALTLTESGSWVATLWDNVSLGARFPCLIHITEDPSYGR